MLIFDGGNQANDEILSPSALGARAGSELERRYQLNCANDKVMLGQLVGVSVFGLEEITTSPYSLIAMKAARYYGPHDIRVEQIDEPVAARGQVKIKVSHSKSKKDILISNDESSIIDCLVRSSLPLFEGNSVLGLNGIMIVGTEVRVYPEIEKTREMLTLDFDF
jgi:hypothetical protein